MRNFLLIVTLVLLVASGLLLGQTDPRYNSITLEQAPPAPLPVNRVTATPSAAGANTYFYWISVTYPKGRMFPIGPITVNNAATLNPGTVTLRYPAQTGASSYIIIRTATATFPVTGTCNACASGAVTATTFVDTGLVLVNNFAASGIQSEMQQLRLNNRNQSVPYIETTDEFRIAPVRVQRGTRNSSLFEIMDGAQGQMIGGRDQKTYALGINVTRPVGFGASNDANDAIIRGTYTNRAVNDNNFIMRGLNTTISNRGSGRVGIMEGGSIGTANRDTAILQTLRGLTVNTENFSTLVAEHGGIDVTLKNEAAVATLEYGIRVRNINNSLATAVTSAYLVSDSGVNIGFSYGLDLGGATIGIADIRGEALDTIANAAAGEWTFTRGSGNFTGVRVQATAFGDLGAPADGVFVYCNDCTIASPCAGAGTGSLAKRLNGVWVCN